MSKPDQDKINKLRMAHYHVYEDISSKHEADLEMSTENNQNYLFEEISFFFFNM